MLGKMDEWMELAVKMTNDAMTEFDPSLEGVFCSARFH